MTQADGAVQHLLAEAAQQLGGPLADDLPLMEVPGLDSLRFMDMITAIEAARGSPLDPDLLGSLETVGDLRRLVA